MLNMGQEPLKKILQEKELKKKEAHEEKRRALLEKVILILKKEFSETNVEIYLVGSISRPYDFNQKSDIDIVVKGFQGNRFELWTHLEELFERNVEIILYEKCHFKEHIDKFGLKVV